MAMNSANPSTTSVSVLGRVNAAATPMISEATTTTAATASTHMARRWEERVRVEATRSAEATTKSPAAALSVPKPISSNLGAAKNTSMYTFYPVPFGREPYVAPPPGSIPSPIQSPVAVDRMAFYSWHLSHCRGRAEENLSSCSAYRRSPVE